MEITYDLCMACMEHGLNEDGTCPNCGAADSLLRAAPHHLFPRSVLSGRYVVGKVIGEGGFGITYVGWDTHLSVKAAIKEYYPNGCVTRDIADGSTVRKFSGLKGDLFERERERFIEEAKRLTRFGDLPGIVAVKDFFKENSTAYLIMEFVEGATLSSVLSSMGGRLQEAHVLLMMKPLITSLAEIHAAGIIHRDIAPDNIMIRPDGSVKLIDFGAAREADADGKSSVVLMKHGYTPEEQYDTDRSRQGTWTDVYSLCATIYRAIEGFTPPNANSRLRDDTFKGFSTPVSESTRIAVTKGLAVSPQHRWQSMGELMQALYPTESLSMAPVVKAVSAAMYAAMAPCVPCAPCAPATPATPATPAPSAPSGAPSAHDAASTQVTAGTAKQEPGQKNKINKKNRKNKKNNMPIRFVAICVGGLATAFLVVFGNFGFSGFNVGDFSFGDFNFMPSLAPAGERQSPSPETIAPAPTAEPALVGSSTLGNTSGNIANEGLAVESDGWVYFADLHDGGSLNKMRANGTGVQKLGEYASCINVVGGWVYYLRSGSLRKVRTSGKNDTEFSSEEGNFGNLHVVGEWIYASFAPHDVDGGLLRKVRADFSGEAQICDDLIESCECFAIDGDWIYYAKDSECSELWRVRAADGLAKERLPLEEGQYLYAGFNVVGGWVYYTGYNDAYKPCLYKIKADGSSKAAICTAEGNVGSINIAGDWVYYSTSYFQDGIYQTSIFKVRADGHGKKHVARDADFFGDSFSVSGGWVYYTHKGVDGNELCRVSAYGPGHGEDVGSGETLGAVAGVYAKTTRGLS